MGAIIPAVDQRVKLTVAILGGLAAAHTFPEVDQINCLTRVTTPVLMINGKHDAIEPVETGHGCRRNSWAAGPGPERAGASRRQRTAGAGR